MSLNAQRKNNSYYVGNYFVTSITKEEYQEILEDCDNKETKLPHCHIIYMHAASKEILSKYAKKVRQSHAHKDKSIKDIKSKISSLKSDLRALLELEELL